MFPLFACGRIQWRAKPLKHAEIRCRSTNDIDEPTVASLSKELAAR